MRRLLPLLLVLTLASCDRTSSVTTTSPSPASLEASSTVTFTGHDSVLHVRVADTEAEREQGLMGVTSLPRDEGMAFVFDAPTTVRFWMKDTLIPLSIAFVDQGGAIVSIDEMTPCTTDPCALYSAAAPYVVAIEANAGWFSANGIGTGDRAVLTTA